ncbi:hypothetical protein LV779_20420 [Streptomyces thinghirensis]|nr:hypothetical protein [Streptomyces thinghirensis]
MGAAVARVADTAVLTSDNPRSEESLAILATMLQGAASVPAHSAARSGLFEDRAAAVAAADFARAEPGDTRAGGGQGPRAGPGHAGRSYLRRPPGASRSHPEDPGMKSR